MIDHETPLPSLWDLHKSQIGLALAFIVFALVQWLALRKQAKDHAMLEKRVSKIERENDSDQLVSETRQILIRDLDELWLRARYEQVRDEALARVAERDSRGGNGTRRRVRPESNPGRRTG